MKLGKWFWGFFFILAGVLVLLNQFNIFGDLSMLTILITIFVLPIFIKSIIHLNFSGILFSLAVLYILYAELLGLVMLPIWVVLLTALFMSLGLTILFGGGCRRRSCHHNEENFEHVINEPDENNVSLRVSFSSSIKYVNSNQLERVRLDCSFGAMKVYFDHCTLSDKGATIDLSASFSGVALYIPKEWNLVNQTNTTLGGIEEKNKPRSENGPQVILTGDISLSGVEIIYV